MEMQVYKVIDDFPVKTARVLVLDRDYEIGDYKSAKIDGKTYEYIVNYGFRTIILPNMAKQNFRGKMVIFFTKKILISKAKSTQQKCQVLFSCLIAIITEKISPQKKFGSRKNPFYYHFYYYNGENCAVFCKIMSFSP